LDPEEFSALCWARGQDNIRRDLVPARLLCAYVNAHLADGAEPLTAADIIPELADAPPVNADDAKRRKVRAVAELVRIAKDG
jgi:hypothetical protein